MEEIKKISKDVKDLKLENQIMQKNIILMKRETLKLKKEIRRLSHTVGSIKK